MEVQALDTGEKMTIVCGHCMACGPQDYPSARIQGGGSKIFKWGRDCCALSTGRRGSGAVAFVHIP